MLQDVSRDFQDLSHCIVTLALIVFSIVADASCGFSSSKAVMRYDEAFRDICSSQYYSEMHEQSHMVPCGLE